MSASHLKHCLHCCLFLAIIVIFVKTSNGIKSKESVFIEIDPLAQYGMLGVLILYALRLIVFLPLPQVFFNFIGLLYYNAFPDKVTLKTSPLLAPFICFRVVTKGNYPQLVKDNVNRNITKCLDVGLENFLIEVVTDKEMELQVNRRIRQIVVPPNYCTTNGAMFKARALHYCLEEKVNLLTDTDWIVHLDEETLLTENSIKGILNFVMDGKHPFGQGLITYANEGVVNWITTLADSFRVTDDMGKLRFQFYMFHKPFFSWKGSFAVTQVSAERAVSFDNGPEGSIAEDCFFAMKAFSKGYTFNFIEGEMWEKSPFTFWDFMQQRKRWVQGVLLVVHSKQIPLRHKLLLSFSCYAWITAPISLLNFLLAPLFPMPNSLMMDIISSFTGAVTLYMFIFGVLKSFTVYRFGFLKFIVCLFMLVLVLPFNAAMECTAVILGVVGKKQNFFIVNKMANSHTIV